MQHSNLMRLSDKSFWDIKTESLFVDNQNIKLSASQKKVLKLLINNINKPVQNHDIFYEVYDSLDKEFKEKSVRNFISGLRGLIGELDIVNIYGGYYMLKSESINTKVKFNDQLLDIIEQSKNPIVVTDPNENDNPIIYVNVAFCDLFGYDHEDVIGKNCRFLHRKDKDQEALQMIREAISMQISVETGIRNYTKNGKVVYEDITISPIFDKQNEKLIYFLGIYKDITLMRQFLEKVKDTL